MKNKRTCVKFIILVSIVFSFLKTQNTYATNFNLTSKSALVMDIETGEVIFAYNATEKVQIASTTKLMTGLLLAENREKKDVIKFTEKAIAQPSTSVFKDVAQKLTVEDSFYADDVMKGLLLKSGNDMAAIIAEDIAGNEYSFSKLMDAKAKELGMLDSDFYTASGLDTEEILSGESHYSTAFDMALLGAAAYKNDWLRETMSLKNTKMSTVDGYEFEIANSNKNLGLDGCVGGKTGYTTKAQRCLVAMYEINDKVLVGVVLGGDNPGYFDDMKKIIDYSANAKPIKKFSKEEVVYEANLSPGFLTSFLGLEDFKIPMYTNEDIYVYENEFNEMNMSYDVASKEINVLRLKEGKPISKVIINTKGMAKEHNLYADITTKHLLYNSSSIYMKGLRIILFVGVIVFILMIIKRNKYTKKHYNT